MPLSSPPVFTMRLSGALLCRLLGAGLSPDGANRLLARALDRCARAAQTGHPVVNGGVVLRTIYEYTGPLVEALVEEGFEVTPDHGVASHEGAFIVRWAPGPIDADVANIPWEIRL